MVVKAYRMIRLNMDMMRNEMKMVKLMNNQMMNNQNHREVNLVLVMMDTCMMRMVAYLFCYLKTLVMFDKRILSIYTLKVVDVFTSINDPG
jgi:hypothetical protein